MGFRNPFRVDVDSDGVIYTSDYSPDANTPSRGRGPAGVGRYEIVRKPSNYGWPTCYSTSSVLGVGVQRVRDRQHHAGPGTPTAPAVDCGGPTQANTSRWVVTAVRVEPGLQQLPPVTDPDVWYSYQDNPNATRPVGSAPRARLPRPRPSAPRRRARPASARACSRSCTTVAWRRTAWPSTIRRGPTRPR